MNKKICFFCVGTGGHVLPVKNLVIELENLGVNPKDIFVISDNRGVQYLENLNINIYITKLRQRIISFKSTKSNK